MRQEKKSLWDYTKNDEKKKAKRRRKVVGRGAMRGKREMEKQGNNRETKR